MMLRPTPEQRSDRPGSDTPIIERLRYVMGNAAPSRRLHIEQTAADALDRILELEAAVREINDLCTAEGNDPRLSRAEMLIAKGCGATVRRIMVRLGI